LRDESGRIVIKAEIVEKRWKEYMKHLLNVKDVCDELVEKEIVQGPREYHRDGGGESKWTD